MISYSFLSTHPEPVHLTLHSFNLVEPLLLAFTRLFKTVLLLSSLPFHLSLGSYINIILFEPLFYYLLFITTVCGPHFRLNFISDL